MNTHTNLTRRWKPLGSLLPADLSRDLKMFAAQHELPMAVILAQAVARRLGRDPSEYGIDTSPARETAQAG